MVTILEDFMIQFYVGKNIDREWSGRGIVRDLYR